MYNQKGFTIVEMMIVVVIVGILAAALFPSLIGYMSRSRDSARLLAIREISNALSSYSTDNDVYPNPGVMQVPTSYVPGFNDGCIPRRIFVEEGYLQSPPFDPIKTRDNGCGNNGEFGYGSGVSIVGLPRYILTSFFESEFGGNIRLDLVDGTMTGMFLTGTQVDLDKDLGASVYKVIKGSGSGYIFYK